LDAGRRCADAYNFQLSLHGENAAGKWIAVKLSDGSGDGVLYDTKKDAVRHQFHEDLCAYICLLPTSMPVDDALSVLRINRKLKDGNMRISDPDVHVQMPLRSEFMR
jgi:hypothetical protein